MTERLVSADGAVPGNAFGRIAGVTLMYRPVELRAPSFVRSLNLEHEQVVGQPCVALRHTEAPIDWAVWPCYTLF